MTFLVKAMNAVQPFGWANFFKSRLEATGGNAPLAGLENAGWKTGLYR